MEETLPPPLPQPPPLPKPYPGFWQAVGLFLIYAFGNAAGSVPFVVADQVAKTHFIKNPWVLGVVTLCGALLVMPVAKSKLGLSLREIVGRWNLPAPLLPPLVTVVIGQLLLTLMMILWTLRAFPKLLDPNQTYGLDKTLIGAAFALMVAAPLSEEFLFRGVFLRGFVPRYGALKGILLGAAMFAAAHLSAAKIFGTFIMGAIFGWWYTKLRSIWPGVIGHALNNGMPVLVAALARSNGVTKQKDLPPFTWAEPAVAAFGALLLVQGLLAMKRYFDASELDAPSTETLI